MANIECVFFDLGGVLYTLDYQSAWNGFCQKCRKPVTEVKKVLYAEDIFYGFERGKISSDEYYSAVIQRLNCSLSFDEFIHIWNSILIKRESMFQVVERLKSIACVVILSNTNELNAMSIQQDVNILTDKIVYSYKTGYMKPDRRIYERALDVGGSLPENSLFFDDIQENVEAAEQLGIKSYLFRDRSHLLDVLRTHGIDLNPRDSMVESGD